MPRVTEAYRTARREQIVEAAIRVLTRKGVARTSIADIIAESGLSAGSIYSNFRNKGELGSFVARTVLGTRVQDVVALARDSAEPLTPRKALEGLLTAVHDRQPPFAVVLQFWGEATVDSDLGAAVHQILGELEAHLTEAITPWAEKHSGATDASALAASTATAMTAIAQSYVVRSALGADLEPVPYLASLAAALG
ncbi:TetR/AcrR family transcriptional regulator [Gryllotalpicola protaetiae]|nr:TetR family transcriptional regulator [Gryllotalpicola protaetiae]